MICPHCQQEHSPDARFCPVTGKQIVPPAQIPQVQQKKGLSPAALAGILLGGAALVAAVVLIVLQIRPEKLAAPIPQIPLATATEMPYSSIVYTSTQGGTANIFLYNLKDGSTKQLTNSVGENWSPAWSSDGSRILFTSNRDGDSEIYVMNADGSSQINLTNNTVEDAFPDWSPDMSRIVFESMRDGNNEIYVMNADGSGQTRLTNYPDLDGLPAWSPDGSRIAFTRVQDGNQDIYIMNADGSGVVNLTNNPANDNSAVWSPDGTQIGFDTNRDGTWEFYTMNPDGSNLTRITDNNGYYGYANWAPGKEYITYTADNNGDLNIGVMTTGGAVVTMLVDSPAMEVESNWSTGYVPGIKADTRTELPGNQNGTPPGEISTPAAALTPDQLPTPSGSTPAAPGSCGVQDGSWSAWAGTEMNLILTVQDCKFTLAYFIGMVDGQWLILSHYMEEPISGPDFNFIYAFDDQTKYQLSGTFTSSSTAEMRLVFFAPFKYSDTGTITEDKIYDMVATLGQ